MTASRRVVVVGAPRVARPALILPLLLLLLLPAAAVAQPPPGAGLQALEPLVVGRAAPGCRGPFALVEGAGEGGSTDKTTTYRRCLAWAGGFWCPAPAPGPAGFAWRPCEAADGSALVGAGGPDGPDGLPDGVTWPAAGLRVGEALVTTGADTSDRESDSSAEPAPIFDIFGEWAAAESLESFAAPDAAVVAAEAGWRGSRAGFGDWVELLNPSPAQAAPLRGVRVTDGKPGRRGLVFEGPACGGLVLAPRERVVLGTNRTGCFRLPFGLGEDDAVRVLAADGAPLAALAWGPAAGRAAQAGDAFGFPADDLAAAPRLLDTASPGGPNAAARPEGRWGPVAAAAPPLPLDAGARGLRSAVPLLVVRPRSDAEASPALVHLSGCTGDPEAALQTTRAVDGAMGPPSLPLSAAACSLTERAQVTGAAVMEPRGRSSRRHAKKQWSLELKEGPVAGALEAADREASPLGLPAHEDWIIAADYPDRSLLRNGLAFALARRAGRWAPRQGFVELLVAPLDATEVSLDAHYRGLYVLREPIRPGADRVAVGDDGYIVEFLSREHEQLFSMDSDKEHVLDTGPSRVVFKHPPRNATEADKRYVRDFLVEAERKIWDSPDMSDRAGWTTHMDPDALIDYVLHAEVTKNLDGYISSTFFSLEPEAKGGRLVAGPAWDYDLAFGNSAGWWNTYSGVEGWLFWGQNQRRHARLPQWVDKLLKDDPAFRARAKARWFELRAGECGPDLPFGVLY